ncbi:unnamed protein product, partial [Hapterophycus canaliculatus]
VPVDVHFKHHQYARQVGPTVRRFHGTSCGSNCDSVLRLMGAAPCREDTCNICSICQHGFKIGTESRRYGKGVYFSSESKKANAYAFGTEKVRSGDGKALRCIIVADVAVGRAYTTRGTGFDHSAYPPPGYDAVIGEVGEGLTSDELVVYSEEAALPSYLVVYALP